MPHVLIVTVKKDNETYTEKVASFKYRDHADEFIASNVWSKIMDACVGYVGVEIIDSTIRRVHATKPKAEKARTKADKLIAKGEKLRAKIKEEKTQPRQWGEAAK